MAASAEDPIRLRVRVGPRSPLHPLLAALPPDAQASALLRWAEAGAAGGHDADPGSQSGGRPASASEPDVAAEDSALVAALTRIAAAVERLADGGARPASEGAPGPMGPSRVERLDSAWDG
jgi:hypothetical protein